MNDSNFERYYLNSCKVPLSNSPNYCKLPYFSDPNTCHYLVLAGTSYLPKPIFYQDPKSIKSSISTKPDYYHTNFCTRIAHLPACPAMNTDTADAILGHHNGLRSWRQPFIFTTREGIVDRSLAIGDKAAAPSNVCHYQPDNYPN